MQKSPATHHAMHSPHTRASSKRDCRRAKRSVSNRSSTMRSSSACKRGGRGRRDREAANGGGVDGVDSTKPGYESRVLHRCTPEGAPFDSFLLSARRPSVLPATPRTAMRHTSVLSRFALSFALGCSAVAASRLAAQTKPVDRANFDTTCAPCQDFYRFANGGCLQR